MATSFNVNLTITSAVGFRRPAYTISSPRPISTTTYDLEVGSTGNTIDLGEIKLITVSTPNQYELYPGGQSDVQVIEVSNIGNTDVTIVSPYFLWSTNGPTPVIDVEPGSLLDALPPVIPAGSTGTFTLAYQDLSPIERQGTYTNWLIVVSDASRPQVKILTTQTILNAYNFVVDPLTTSTTVDTIGGVFTQTFAITPIINAEERPDVLWETSATIMPSSDPGWSVYETGFNSATVRFKANTVNNATGTYTATILLSAYEIEKEVTATASVDIDYSQYTQLSSWVSSASPENSVIGVSYDIIQGQRYLTIGVGMGGDGSPQYNQGGSIFVNTAVLSFAGPTYDAPYTAWSTVYRFLIGNTAQTFYSGETDAENNYLYKVKSTDAYNYDYYFGNESRQGSMFIVSNDGYGNVSIKLNSLRELSGDSEFDSTLKNLTRVFHYYSDVDSPARINNIDVAPIKNGTFTHLFNGFNRSGNILTSIVPLPVSF